MRKWFVGAAALGLLAAVSLPGTADAAQRKSTPAVKGENALEVSAQYRGYRRGYYRPYRAYRSYAYYPRAYYRPYYRPYYASPGYYPGWYSPVSYGYGGYGYGGYGYGYGYRPFISIGLPGFGIWF
jgi:hypothetical protein